MKKVLISIFIGIFTFMLVGCAPKGDPSQVMKDYYQNIKDGNIEGAYDKLSEASKKNFSKEDFIKWQSVSKETSQLKDFKVEKSNEYKDKELDGLKFKNVVEFNITEKLQDLFENKENSSNYKRNVVNDNGTWKVYRGKENGKEKVADALNNLAIMYLQGKGKTKDLNQAAILLNEALKYDKECTNAYFSLGVVYSDLGRYDESINLINTFISKEKDNNRKSLGYNALGNNYLGKNDKNKAKEFYNKALELDPNNQYAKTNLQYTE
ncbi:tetratricopeptide repeat protein [Clostridium aciditolerans]|uniref:Tetratricopeptide repeat protein n=1 Tax=Clostridium aciditolerans TaxID=339861 RepID=A0A934I2N0_9CLOT|nr:tetratricopeptide repeat protein [Clostridium aciditolerans]MBI6875168.1 tetratricopeptide repeat protein [Clostridium aciditolerans]